jgi:hypothetical protein
MKLQYKYVFWRDVNRCEISYRYRSFSYRCLTFSPLTYSIDLSISNDISNIFIKACLILRRGCPCKEPPFLNVVAQFCSVSGTRKCWFCLLVKWSLVAQCHAVGSLLWILHLLSFEEACITIRWSGRGRELYAGCCLCLGSLVQLATRGALAEKSSLGIESGRTDGSREIRELKREGWKVCTRGREPFHVGRPH